MNILEQLQMIFSDPQAMDAFATKAAMAYDIGPLLEASASAGTGVVDVSQGIPGIGGVPRVPGIMPEEKQTPSLGQLFGGAGAAMQLAKPPAQSAPQAPVLPPPNVGTAKNLAPPQLVPGPADDMQRRLAALALLGRGV